MTEPRIPQGGLRKPDLKRYPVTIATSREKQIERFDNLGRYRVWWSKENRCLEKVQVGASVYGVVNEFGFLVPVDKEVLPWV